MAVVNLALQSYDTVPMIMQTSDQFALPSTGAATITVYERSPRWALAVRQSSLGTKIVELRVLDDIIPAMQGNRFGILLLEVAPKRAPQIVSLLVRLQTEFPHVMTIACVAAASPRWEALLREAGAALVVASPRQLLRVVPWMTRHLQRAPIPKLNLREQLWSQLPWPEAAATASPDA